MNGQFPLWDTPAENHGSCIHQNKYPVQDDEYNYHDDSLQAIFKTELGIVFIVIIFLGSPSQKARAA